MADYSDEAQARREISDWNYPHYTARELGNLWSLASENLDLLEGTELGEYFIQTDSSPIQDSLGQHFTVYSKPGWTNEATNDAGLILDGQNVYVISILSDAPYRLDLVGDLADKLGNLVGVL